MVEPGFRFCGSLCFCCVLSEVTRAVIGGMCRKVGVVRESGKKKRGRLNAQNAWKCTTKCVYVEDGTKEGSSESGDS